MTVPIWKVIGQLVPAAATPEMLYAVPEGKQTAIETFLACNLASYATTLRVSVRQSGAAVDNKQFIFCDFAIQAKDTVPIVATKLHLFTHDQVWVQSASGLVAFNAFGQEEFV